MIDKISPTTRLSDISQNTDKRVAASSIQGTNTLDKHVENLEQTNLRVEQIIPAINNMDTLNALINQTNINLQNSGTSINLSISKDSETGKSIIRLIDNETREVIRQIPPENILNIARTIDQFLENSKGSFINEVV